MSTLKEILTRRPVAATIRLTVPAGGARPAPPVGPALGQYRLNLMAFCKDFNARTQKYKPDTPMSVTITAFKDNTFEFTVKSPSVTWYLKKAAGIESGSGRPGHVVASTLTLKHVYEIAKLLFSLDILIERKIFLHGKQLTPENDGKNVNDIGGRRQRWSFWPVVATLAVMGFAVVGVEW
ncbi:hypothetical protein Vadar_017435 [Vaccinium darrowii]|uniref:Uncharacterized protein n=1 Tax=Vaccinium darrowii TaxID=229202 RepID=A0ACB7YEQ9_9ERIC|nr:hypothetical protein Vadar_017435 [Vaccinium darrowii]